MGVRGFQAKDVMDLTELSYRQIDHWVRSDIITPCQIIEKGNRSTRIFSFNNLVTIRAAMKMLEFGLGFPVVKQAAMWLHKALAEGKKGQYLFFAEGENLKFLSDNPDEIVELIRGKCVCTVDLLQIVEQLKKDIDILKNQNDKKDLRKNYSIPEIA